MDRKKENPRGKFWGSGALVVYDVETLRLPDEVDGGWGNPEGMGFGIACAFDYDQECYQFFCGEDGRVGLCKFLHGKTVVSFNGIVFDSRVVLGNDRVLVNRHTAAGQFHWLNIDLLLEYVCARFILKDAGPTTPEHYAAAIKHLAKDEHHDHTYSLDGLATGSLGISKDSSGALVTRLLDAGQYSAAYGHCLQDVRLTKFLLEYMIFYSEATDRAGLVSQIHLPFTIKK